MNINPAQLGFLRGLGVVLLTGILTYLGDATHLQGVLNPATASFISMLALSFEHYLEGKRGMALFGSVNVIRSDV